MILLDLPEDVLSTVCKSLENKDLACLGSVCTFFRSFVETVDLKPVHVSQKVAQAGITQWLQLPRVAQKVRKVSVTLYNRSDLIEKKSEDDDPPWTFLRALELDSLSIKYSVFPLKCVLDISTRLKMLRIHTLTKGTANGILNTYDVFRHFTRLEELDIRLDRTWETVMIHGLHVKVLKITGLAEIVSVIGLESCTHTAHFEAHGMLVMHEVGQLHDLRIETRTLPFQFIHRLPTSLRKLTIRGDSWVPIKHLVNLEHLDIEHDCIRLLYPDFQRLSDLQSVRCVAHETFIISYYPDIPVPQFPKNTFAACRSVSFPLRKAVLQLIDMHREQPI